MNLTAEQTGKFTTNRESKAGAAILTAGASVGLLERLKNKPLFLSRYADTRIGNLECNHGS